MELAESDRHERNDSEVDAAQIQRVDGRLQC